MSPFDLQRPVSGDTPVLVEIPHAGLDIPDELREEVIVSEATLRGDADIYVDRLYQGATDRGATTLAARLSRYVVDLNRAADDVDAQTVTNHPSPRPNQPRGVVWRLTTDGRPALARPLDLRQFRTRIARFHAPYHATLRSELDRLRSRFGYVILLAGHSMPSVGRAGHADTGARRADIVPGTQGRTTADRRVIDLVDAHFRAAGLSVRHDDPYRGGWTTALYGKPAERQHAIQVEINRAIYVDEKTCEPRVADMARLQTVLLELVANLGALDLAS